MNRAMRRPWQRKAAGAWAEQGTARQPHLPCAHPAPAGPHPDGLATQRMTCRGPPQETTAPTGRCCRSVRREEGLHAADGSVRLKAARNGLPGCKSASRSVITLPIVLDRVDRRHAAPAGMGFTGARKFTAHDAGLGRLRLQPKHPRPGVHRICGSPQQGAKDECAPGDAHPAAAGGSQASQIVKYSHTPRTAGKGLQETMQQAQQAAECGRQTAAGSASGRIGERQDQRPAGTTHLRQLHSASLEHSHRKPNTLPTALQQAQVSPQLAALPCGVQPRLPATQMRLQRCAPVAWISFISSFFLLPHLHCSTSSMMPHASVPPITASAGTWPHKYCIDDRGSGSRGQGAAQASNRPHSQRCRASNPLQAQDCCTCIGGAQHAVQVGCRP